MAANRPSKDLSLLVSNRGYPRQRSIYQLGGRPLPWVLFYCPICNRPPGQLPIILSVPHGGYTTPTTIPDRNCTDCVYIRDAWTQELGQAVDSVLTARTGCAIHLVVNLLHRVKMDPNREIVTAANGNPTAEQAWRAYHDALAQAKQTVIQQHGKGLLIDIHGHGHAIQRL